MKSLILITLIAVASCNSNTTKIAPSKTLNSNQTKENIEVKLKSNTDKLITIGDEVTITYETLKPTLPDSIGLSIDSRHFKNFKNSEKISWKTINEKPGIRLIQLTFYWGDTLSASSSINYELLSDIKPKLYTFKIINKWSHSTKAYTQGLEFSDGFLYEGTGEYGKSMMYKLDLDKNEILQSTNLPDNIFGEGITIIQDKIYQITWRSNIGYVYEKNTLKKLYDFNYPTEGWGLTNNGKELIMSDGSENIYFLDTEFLQETHHIQVYDNKGAVKSLNELEYIDGLIYANVYGSDEIVTIDSETGKVLKRINLTGILNKKEIKSPIDVLNGIAWDKQNKRLIVTGKWWPYFFEIQLIESH